MLAKMQYLGETYYIVEKEKNSVKKIYQQNLLKYKDQN